MSKEILKEEIKQEVLAVKPEVVEVKPVDIGYDLTKPYHKTKNPKPVPMVRVKFIHNEQPLNPQQVHLTDFDVDFDQKLYPGEVYEIPVKVMHFLNGLVREITECDASGARRKIGEIPRFTCIPV